ncbi:MAG: ferritin-like protein [SAR202 cluster bacterium]|jgi:hypothetical protein|nr:ferritin-like protein [SAR202 cluster bacterium]MDP6714115.1 ferritin-like protein [SAR202 cluster bacterium]
MALTTVQDLRTHLQWAAQVELTTIPTYLYAMYSIKNQASASANVFRSVVIEEMLHVALASNLLVSVGGQPKFYHPDIVPMYPGPVPHHREGFTVNLERASVEYVRDTCMAIEFPEEAGAIPEDDNFDTIGQFYLALENCFRELCAQPNHQVFADNDPNKQLTEGYMPEISDTGDLTLITDLDSAMSAMETIVEQGEGIQGSHYDDPSKKELAHYYKFERIAKGDAPLGDVWPVVKSPKTADYPEPLRDLSNLFNGCYCYMLLALEDIFLLTDAAEKHRLVFRGLYSVMISVMPMLARMMMQQPIAEGADENAGPTFEYFPFEHGVSKEAQLEELCVQAQKTNEGLDRILSIITTLPDMTEM